MRLIKLVLISVVVLFALITGIASLLPSHVRISRAIDINAPADRIYPKLADVRQWDGWNEYIRFYHNKRPESDRLMSQEITIVLDQKSDTLITASWQQLSGSKFGSGYQLISYPGRSLHTTLQWYFDFNVKWYPWEKFQSIVYDEQLGPVMEKSLQNLKQQVEQSK
jgi:hypothetical protein